MLGDWPIFQLTEGADDGSCVLLSGVVAVLGCCIVAGHILRGMTRVRAGQAPVGSTYKPTVLQRDDSSRAYMPLNCTDMLRSASPMASCFAVVT